MAESREKYLARQLSEAVKKIGTDRRLHPEKAERAPEYIEKAYSDIYLHSQKFLSESDVMELRNPDSPYRFSIAMRALEKAAAKKPAGTTKKPISQGQTARNIHKLLTEADERGLSKDDQKKIIESTFLISGASDALNPDEVNADELRNEILERKAQAALIQIKAENNNNDTVAELFTKQRQKILEVGVSDQELDDELFEVQKQKTIAHVTEIANNKEVAGRYSNSLGELYALEMGISSLAAGGTALTAEQKARILAGIGENSATVGALMKNGQGVQFLRNPSGYLASRAGNQVAQRVTARITSVAAGRLAGTALGTALGSVAPVIGNVVGSFVGNVMGKYIGGAIRGAVSIGRKSAMAAAGAFVVIGGAFAHGMAVAASAGSLSAIILVPIVAVIMLIINSGGYIVPPSANLDGSSSDTDIFTEGGTTENQYLTVIKRANPAGPFQNSALPTSITYTIEVRAKRPGITNLNFTYSCSAIAAAGNINCPPNPTIPAAPETLEQGTPFTFEYTQNYSTAFRDSVVMDSFTVSGSAGGTPTGDAVGFASVIFGKPPTRCFVFGSSLNPITEIPPLIAAIGQMNRESRFMDTLCARVPTITIERGTENVSYGGRTVFPRIYLFTPAFSNGLRSVFYTLTHETGHIFANAQTSQTVFKEFIELPFPTSSSGYICTYPSSARAYNDDNRGKENFAESIALYFLRNSLSSSGVNFTCMDALGGSFDVAYPNYYNFMRDKIFN